MIDADAGVVSLNGKTIVLRPKAQAVLARLARNPGHVISKSDLLDSAWPDIHVTEDSLSQAIREVRKAIGDDRQTIIRTVARRGYLLDARAADPAEISAKPVVAVMRFRDETGDGAILPLLDGFAEDIIAGLARFGTVTVLARHSSFAVERDVTGGYGDARRATGADYFVEGAARRSADAFRVTAHLVDATTLRQLWSRRYDAEKTNIFAALDEIVAEVVAHLAQRLDDAVVEAGRLDRPRELAAYDLMTRGLAILRLNDPHRYAEGAALIERSIARDPANGLAHAHLAFAKVMIADFGRAERTQLDEALIIAARAAELAPNQATPYRVLSFIEMYRRAYEVSEHHLRRALALNPNDAESIEQMGYLITLRGRPAEALGWMDRAVRLNPIHPDWYNHDRAFALYLLGEYRQAAAAIARTPVPQPWMLTWLAACHAQAGDRDAAAACIARLKRDFPRFSARRFADGNGAAFEFAADAAHFAEGVLRALDA